MSAICAAGPPKAITPSLRNSQATSRTESHYPGAASARGICHAFRRVLDDLRAVAARLRTDARFYRLVLEWPDELCDQYALSADEIDALQAGDSESLHRLGLSSEEAHAVAQVMQPLRAARRAPPSMYSRRAQFRAAYGPRDS